MGETLQKERKVDYGILQLQMGGLDGGGCVTTYVLEFYLQNGLGNSMVCLLLRAVYCSSLTLPLADKWDEAKNRMCRLCATEIGTVQHILSGCWGLGAGTRAYVEALNQIQSWVD